MLGQQEFIEQNTREEEALRERAHELNTKPCMHRGNSTRLVQEYLGSHKLKTSQSLQRAGSHSRANLVEKRVLFEHLEDLVKT